MNTLCLAFIAALGSLSNSNSAGLSLRSSIYLHGREVDVLDGGNLLLQYNRARYYDIKNGHWLQRDPAGFADSANLYESFGSNPAHFIDPEGRLTKLASGFNNGDEVLYQRFVFSAKIREFSVGRYYYAQGRKYVLYDADIEAGGFAYILPFEQVEQFARGVQSESDYESFVVEQGVAVDRRTGKIIKRTIGEDITRAITQAVRERERHVELLFNSININNLIGGPAFTAITGEDLITGQTVPGRFRVLSGVVATVELLPTVSAINQISAGVARAGSAAQASRPVSPIALSALETQSAPNAAAVLQSLAQQQNILLRNDLALAQSFLSEAELRAAQRIPSIARIQFGNAVHRMVAAQIRANPALRSLLDPRGIPGRGPDFLGLGPAAGQTFDITTSGQVRAHLLRPYGPGLNIIIYERPPNFVVFPP